jgi:hypothetical protein
MSDCSFSILSAAQGGSVTEMMSAGAFYIYLNAGATMSHWRSRYPKCTQFAMESLEQAFNTTVAFGTEVQITLNKTADLIYYTYVVIDLPGIIALEDRNRDANDCFRQQFVACDSCDPYADGLPPGSSCKTSCGSCPTEPQEPLSPEEQLAACSGVCGPWAHWTNAIGQFLVKKAGLVIGSQQVDHLTNDYLFMWEELTGKPGKRLMEMIGKAESLEKLIYDSREDRRLWVPLPFSYTLNSGNALPQVSLHFHGIQIAIGFETLNRCISVSAPGVRVVKARDGQPLNANDLRARLEVTHVYLDVDERDRFSTGRFEQLITQVQPHYASFHGAQARIQIPFSHPIIELIWAARRRLHEQCNNHFCFSGKWGRDPIKCACLKLNNLVRVAPRPGAYFRLVQPYQHHTNIPNGFIYCFSFALYPESPAPSGQCNFSRIDQVELLLELQDDLATEDVQIILFGRNWQVYKYRCGTGGIAFA